MNLLKLNNTIINLDNITTVKMKPDKKEGLLCITFDGGNDITFYKDEAKEVFEYLTSKSQLLGEEAQQKAQQKTENTIKGLKTLGGRG